MRKSTNKFEAYTLFKTQADRKFSIWIKDLFNNKPRKNEKKAAQYKNLSKAKSMQ